MKNNNSRVVIIGAGILASCLIVLCGGTYLIASLGFCSFNPEKWHGTALGLTMMFMSIAFVFSAIATLAYITSTWKEKNNEKTTN